MSSGAAVVNSAHAAIGASISSFYDEPEEAADRLSDWTLTHYDDLYRCNIQVPEPGYTPSLQMKNRNCVILFQHSCVQKMLASL